jgi:hypothetical protein
MPLYSIYCDDCQHDCHCDEPKYCTHEVGIGMSDKWDYCRCKKCNCVKSKEKAKSLKSLKISSLELSH